MQTNRKADYEARLRSDIGAFHDDPLGYALYNFPWGVKGTPLEKHKGPRTWQRRRMVKIRDALRSGAVSKGEVLRHAVASGHGIGKSAFFAMIIMWAMDTAVDTRGVVTANTETQLRTKTWAELSKWHVMALTRHWTTCAATSIHSNLPKHEKTWRIDAVPWSEQNTEAFAGLHNEGKRLVLIFDEASAIADKVWEVAQGALTDKDTEIFWFAFGNATRATGRFRECFRKEKANWDHEQIDSRTVEGINLVEIQKLVDTHGEDSDIVKVRVRGVFPVLSAKQFISEKDVDAAFGRHLKPEQYEWAPKIITCDPAWSGDDPLVIGMRQGLRFQMLHTMAKNDDDVAVANIIARLEDQHQADAVFIDFGYGTGIVSVGRALGRDWRLVNFGEAGLDLGDLNMRASIWRLMRDWFKQGGSIEEDQELRDELLGIETKPRLDGKLQLESKEEMKRRGLPSPNKADSLAISFAYPVQAKPRHIDGTLAAVAHLDRYGGPSRDAEVYNPMG